MAKNLAGYLNFFWAGVARQTQTGAIFPSQRYLIEKMIAPIPANYRGVIAELGAGTGALTIRLATRCPGAKILACEINPVLAKDLRHNLDRAGINGQVQVVREAAVDYHRISIDEPYDHVLTRFLVGRARGGRGR